MKVADVRWHGIRNGRWRQWGPRDPGLAVARELRARGHTVSFIGTRRGMEAKLVPPEGFPIEWIEIGGLKRVGLRKTLSTLAELPVSVWQASRLLRRAAPAAVFSTGGYVGRAGLAGGLVEAHPDRGDGAQCRTGIHPPASGAVRGARAGKLSRDRALVSGGPRRNSPVCRCARNFSPSRRPPQPASDAF